MAEIEPNPVSNDLSHFKEEILKLVRESENKLTAQIANKESALNTDYENFVSKINLLLNNNKEMISTMVSQKLKLEKISELESFKNKVDSMLITHEIRIKNNVDEIEKIKTRYDKIISDNLYVAGFIGSSCQFRNLSEYINYNITEVSRLKMEKEQLKKELKDLKSKWDGIMKTVITMNDNTVKLCNKYTDNKQGYFQTLLDNAKDDLNQKSMDMRVMAQKFQSEEEKKMEELVQTINKLTKSETNLNNLINDNFYICEKQHEEMKNNIKSNKEKINMNKNTLNDLNEKFSDIQPNLIIIDNLQTRVSKLYEMVRNISARSAVKKNNIDISKSVVQSPILKRQKKRGSNPDIFKVNEVNTENNILKPPAPNKLQKSVKFPLVKNLNLNSIANSVEETNKTKSKKKEDKNQEFKFKSNLTDLSTSINLEKIKKNINDSMKEKEEEKEKPKEKIKIKEEEEQKEINIKEEKKDKENSKEINNDIEKEKFQEKEKIKIPILSKPNIPNTIQTLPVLTINGSRNSKHINLKSLELENSNSLDNPHTNKFKVMNNITQTYSDYSNMPKMKKIGLDINKENGGCKVVSLKLSPDGSKEGLPKGKRPPKPQYDIVNSLINDYRAKLFSKIHSHEQMDDMNNEILEMPKRVSQAFGRTAYTFYFNKDNFGKKGNNMGNNVLKSGIKNENENKLKK